MKISYLIILRYYIIIQHTVLRNYFIYKADYSRTIYLTPWKTIMLYNEFTIANNILSVKFIVLFL